MERPLHGRVQPSQCRLVSLVRRIQFGLDLIRFVVAVDLPRWDSSSAASITCVALCSTHCARYRLLVVVSCNRIAGYFVISLFYIFILHKISQVANADTKIFFHCKRDGPRPSIHQSRPCPALCLASTALARLLSFALALTHCFCLAQTCKS